MAQYRIYPKLVFTIDSPRSPAQIRNALVGTAPTIRDALKQVVRDQLAKDASGQTIVTSWHFHWGQTDGLDLDDGLPADEIE